MPSHFSKYNYAICRRLSRASVDKISAYVDLIEEQNNGTNGKSKDHKKKKSSKKGRKHNKEIELNTIQRIDYDSANLELTNFIATLRMLNVDVIELCPDDELKYESVFIGDTAVSVNGLALLCKPRNREEEIQEVKQILSNELNLPVIEIKDPEAILNGGDVLWTGREIFVGISNETNHAGARAVASSFPEYSVTPIAVPDKGNLCLKSYITMAGPDILCVNRSEEAQIMLKRMKCEASYNYKLVTVDDDLGSNVLYTNGTLLHRNDLPNSVATLEEKIDYSRVPIKVSELTKNHPFHGLDSLCLLVRKSHRLQTIV